MMATNYLASRATNSMPMLTSICLITFVLFAAAQSLAIDTKTAWIPIAAGPESADFSREATAEPFNSNFDEGIHGWDILALDDAEGLWRIEQHNGNTCVAIRKTNGRGAILLRSKTPVILDPAGAYAFRAFYQSSDAPQTASFLIRIEKRPGYRDYDASIEHGVGLGSQRSIINSPTGVWTKLLHQVSGIGSKGKGFPNLILEGNACTVRVDRIEFEPLAQAKEVWSKTHHYTPRPKPDLIPREDMLKQLDKLPEVSARMKQTNGVTTLLINDKPNPAVFYKENPGQPEYHLGGPFLESGVRLQLVDVGTKSLWVGHHQYDVESAIEAIELALRGAPEAQLILDLTISAYKGWGERYPEELWKNADGLSGVRIGTHIVEFSDSLLDANGNMTNKLWQYSYFSPVWREQAKEALRTYLQRLRNTPYAKRIVGAMISGGHDGQFAMKWPDHSSHAQKAFQQWLKETYGTSAALSEAWGREIRSFGDVTIPNDLQEGKYFNRSENDWIYDPKTEQNRIDYRIFYHEALAELHDEFAQLCKETMGKDILTIRYFMSGFNNGFQSTMGVTRKILPSAHIDAIAPQPAYGLRRPGKPLVMRQALDSYHLHNKLVITEFDHRTWLRTGGSDEMRHIAMSSSATLEDYTSVQRKLMGASIARGQGFWFYDMVAGWYHDPDIQDVIRQTVNNYPLSVGKRNFRADVAVIIDEETVYGLPTISGIGHPALSRSQIEQLNLLSTSGVPYDIYYLDDLTKHPHLSEYKVFIFLSTWRVTESQHQFLDRLKSRSRTLVWMYAPGYSNGRQLNMENMEKLTGIRIRSAGKRATEPVYISNRSHPLSEGLMELQGIGYLSRSSWMRSTDPTIIDVPQFYAEDHATATLARFSRSGNAAISVREFPDWKSVYIADPGGISPEFMNKLAQDANAYVLTEPSISMEMNSKFISVHGLKTGNYVFRLPGQSTVRDLNNEVIIAKDAQSFEHDICAGKTYWFGIEQKGNPDSDE